MSKLALFGGSPVIRGPFKKYNPIGEEEAQAASQVVRTGVLSDFVGVWGDKFRGGEKVRLFEEMWARRFGVRHAIAMNSATSCLVAAVGATGVGPGDEVIVSPYTMAASATAILAFNAVPVFADIEPETFNLDPASVEARLSPHTKAILVPNIFGHPAELDRILSIARKHNLKIIEDNAQSPLAEYKGKLTGTLGDIGVFSLNYHKHIHTGEGGVCVTNDDNLADYMRLIRNHAEAVIEAKGNTHLINMVGFNFRLGEIEAAIGIEQLKKLDTLIAGKVRECGELTTHLAGIPLIAPPLVKPDCKHVYYVYSIKYQNGAHPAHRDMIVKALQAEGAPLSGGYVKPLYLLPMYQRQTAYGDKGCPFKCPLYQGKVSYAKGICPNAEKMHFDSLMIYPACGFDLSSADMRLLGEAFQKVFTNLDGLAAKSR